VVTADDSGYDAARRVWNGRIDRHPLAIVFASDLEAVQATIAVARDHDLQLFVRGGGHNCAGTAVGDGLVLDVSGLRTLERDANAATIRVGAGLRWGELDRATQPYGLAVPGGTDSEVGVAGLTLGGGNGWLMGAFGATVDSLQRVELVTADGQCRVASARDDPDLFWALRGGGGNYGVATSFTYRLHQVGPQVVGGMIAYRWDQAIAALSLYREFVAGAPDELTAYACLLYLEDAPVVAIALCWCGPIEQAERILRPLRELEPVADQIGVVPFVSLQSMMAPARPAGRHCAMRSHYMAELGDAALAAFVDSFEACPSTLSVSIIEHCHGAISRVAPTDTAFAPRRHPFHIEHIAFWDAGQGRPEVNLRWVEACYAATSNWGTSEVYVNSLDEGEGHRVPEAYGPNYQRLRALKAVYDPDNFFRGNQNIVPAERTPSNRDTPRGTSA
jgi:FAD binding domain/Berberine and berberine like